MRKKLLLGNWKMNKTIAEAKEFALASHEISAYANENGILVGVSPTYLSLQTVKENVGKDEAEEMKKKLEAAGAKVELK